MRERNLLQSLEKVPKCKISFFLSPEFGREKILQGWKKRKFQFVKEKILHFGTFPSEKFYILELFSFPDWKKVYILELFSFPDWKKVYILEQKFQNVNQKIILKSLHFGTFVPKCKSKKSFSKFYILELLFQNVKFLCL